jgi:hypothetical protein
VLKSKSFINQATGKPYKAVENIVLSSFDEKSGELRSPAMPFDELEKWVQKIMKEKLVDLAKEMKMLTNTEIFVRENIDIQRKIEEFIGAKIISQAIKRNELNLLHEYGRLKEDFEKDKKSLEYVYLHQSVNY